MARRVLFFFLSLVVFAAALSSGYSYYQAREADFDYTQSLILKAKIGKVVEDANRSEKQEREKREKLQARLETVRLARKDIEEKKKKLEQRIVSLQASVVELKIKRTLAEEAMKSAVDEANSASKPNTDLVQKVTLLEKGVARLRKQKESLEGDIKQYKQKLEKADKYKGDMVRSQAEAEKKIYMLKKELKQSALQLKKAQEDLTKATDQVKTLSGSKSSSKNELAKKQEGAEESKDEKVVGPDKKTLTRLQKERDDAAEALVAQKALLEKVNQQLADAHKTTRALQGELDNSKDKSAKLENELAQLKADSSKKLAEAQKKIAQEKKNSLKEIASLKEALKAKEAKKSVQVAEVKKNKLKDSPSEKKEDKDKERTKKEENERAKNVQAELKRLGCYGGKVDGVWGRGSLNALVNFSKSANLSRVRKYPTTRTLEILKAKTGTFCSDKKNEGNQAASQANNSAATPYTQTLREQCLASCVGAFESVQSCRENC